MIWDLDGGIHPLDGAWSEAMSIDDGAVCGVEANVDGTDMRAVVWYS